MKIALVRDGKARVYDSPFLAAMDLLQKPENERDLYRIFKKQEHVSLDELIRSCDENTDIEFLESLRNGGPSEDRDNPEHRQNSKSTFTIYNDKEIVLNAIKDPRILAKYIAHLGLGPDALVKIQNRDPSDNYRKTYKKIVEDSRDQFLGPDHYPA